MTNKSAYNFLKLSPTKVLIIFKTLERPDAYYNEITIDLKKHTLNADLYFDFLANNGPNDRFYSAIFQDGVLKLNSFKKINLPSEYVKKSNNYFSKNWKIIENNSILTPFQKSFFKTKLKVKTNPLIHG